MGLKWGCTNPLWLEEGYLCASLLFNASNVPCWESSWKWNKNCGTMPLSSITSWLSLVSREFQGNFKCQGNFVEFQMWFQLPVRFNWSFYEIINSLWIWNFKSFISTSIEETFDINSTFSAAIVALDFFKSPVTVISSTSSFLAVSTQHTGQSSVDLPNEYEAYNSVDCPRQIETSVEQTKLRRKHLRTNFVSDNISTEYNKEAFAHNFII